MSYFALAAQIHENPVTLVSVRDLKVSVLNAGLQEQETIPSGTSFQITATDGKSFVEAKWMMDAAAAFRLSKTQTHGTGRSTVSASMNVLKCCHMQDKKGIKKMRKLRADFHTHTTYCDGKVRPARWWRRHTAWA